MEWMAWAMSGPLQAVHHAALFHPGPELCLSPEDEDEDENRPETTDD